MVNRRLIIFLLAATLGASQGGLVYAASALNAKPIAVVLETPSPGLPPGSETACLRGGQPCGGYGSEGCCAEMAAAGAVAGAVGAWLAAGIAAYYYAAYC
jgi:hypothetical protein